MEDPAPEARAGNFLSDSFNSQLISPRGRRRLGEIANEVAVEFRLADELPRGDPAAQTNDPLLGDRIVAASLDEVLGIVATSDQFGPFQAVYTHGTGRHVRSAYGYTTTDFARRWGVRATERGLVCVAADVWFNPYACGFWEATAMSRTTLRIDLRSVTNLIWTWATVEHRALAYALSAARQHMNGSWMAFEPFTKLYNRVLQLHWTDEDACHEISTFLSALTVERLQLVKPGRSGKLHLYAPLINGLCERADPRLLTDLLDESRDPVQEFAEGAGPICRQVFLGTLDDDKALGGISALYDAIAGLSERTSK